MKLGAKDLRKPLKATLNKISLNRQPIFFVLDEVLDTYNIGSFFRLADAVAAEKLYLCGIMEHPPSSRIHKAAVGTELFTPWEKADSAIDIVRFLKKCDVQIISIEQDPRSISLNDLNPKYPVALVAGNESQGIKKEILDLSDSIIELPMLGVNKSFNVWGSAAIVSYTIISKLVV